VEPADVWDRVVLGDLDAASEQDTAEFVEVGHDEGGMSFLRWAKIRFDADVELLSAALEPAAAAGPERFRLLNFGQGEERAVKFAGSGFTSLRRGDLQVIELDDAGFHKQYKIPVSRRFYAPMELVEARGTKRLPENR
jgi:hypothetical protein